MFTNHIHADDLAAACAAALEHGRAGRSYNVSDDSELRMGNIRPRRRCLRPAATAAHFARRGRARDVARAALLHARIAPARQSASPRGNAGTRLVYRRSTTVSAPPSTKQGIRHARDQGPAHLAGGRLVRRPLLPAAHLRQSRHGPADSTPERERLLLMAGKLLPLHDAARHPRRHLGLWLWFGYGFTGGWLHAKTALVTLLDLLSPLLRPVAARLHRRHLQEEPCLVPLVQRTAGTGAVRHRVPRHPSSPSDEQLLSPPARAASEALLAEDVVAPMVASMQRPSAAVSCSPATGRCATH